MPDRAPKQPRTRSRSPSLHPPRRATIKDLSEEAIDLVCAYIRDDDDAEVATEALCSLTRTARLFYSSATRALLHDPTRALFRGDIDSHWPRMSELLQKLLREPALGRHVKRLDRVPDHWYIRDQSGMSDVQYSNWILTLGLLCPSIFSLAIPITLPGNSPAATAFRSLARRSDLRHLILSLAYEDEVEWEFRIPHKCQDVIASLDLSRCISLQLPQFDFDCADAPDRSPTLIPTKSLLLQDCFDEMGARLGRYFDLRHVRSVEYRSSFLFGMDLAQLRTFPPELDKLTVCGALDLPPRLSWQPVSFPRLTQLAIGKFDLVFRDLVDIVHQFPLLRNLDFTHSVWTGYVSTARVWPESLRYLRHLRTLCTGTIRCDTASACKRLRDAITNYCVCNDISVICTAVPILCACCGDSSEDEHSTSKSEEQQDSGEDAVDGIEDVEDPDDDDSAVDEWLRALSVESPVPDYERFDRDGIQWHWVFDARGRPTAVPDDLTWACADEAALSDQEDDFGTEASVVFMPPVPDVPRLEDGYEAQDTDDEDCDDFGPEPWLTWSELCDFESADAAWARFDIDDECEEMCSSEGEISEEEECGGEDDEHP